MVGFEVEQSGRRLPFEVRDTSGALAANAGADLGDVVVGALVQALGQPAIALARAVVLTVNRGYSEIRIEMQGARQDTRIKLFTVTAQRFNQHLLQLDADPHWDPEVKQLLDQALRDELRKEIAKLRRN
ncbi:MULTISPECIES: hypothetical protein [unclassified Amycolatopsis]|uniref:hypothetical protein n=1 Tax=unclassified Amycolatopsis TaxID=2618356 RepID=UPI001A8D5098|nr:MULTISPECIES: hypothetical protein [unclassified Amycolatopsis]HET6707816.1 hypothetical protein [Amycolatopsis sp.]